ncbi:MAG: response regulator [Candidatus Omnitrophica bacterium]|nr:response regulator [Candidatus Omnitrophota bacterium]
MAKKILIIDDEPLAQSKLKDILQQEGHEVMVVLDGKSGIEQAEKQNPDLIITDIVLPDISGFEVCHTIKRNKGPGAPKIILVTGNDGVVDAVEAGWVGAEDFMAKTSDHENLLKKIRQYLK